MEIGELLLASRAMDEGKRDFRTHPHFLEFRDDGRIAVPNIFVMRDGYEELEISDWALNQICERFGPPPVKYMKACPAHLMAENLNYWKRQITGELFVRAYHDTCRAVLSNRYVPIQNTAVLEAAAELMSEVGHHLVRPYLSPDAMHIKISMATNDKGTYLTGAYVGNGETGNRAFTIRPFIQRTSCENSILMTEGAFYQRHVAVTQAYIRMTLKEKLGTVFAVAADTLERIVAAEGERIPDLARTIGRICAENNLSQAVRDNILIGTEGMGTVMGVVNGLSYAAHVSDLDIERQIDLETLAGQWLEGSRLRFSVRPEEI